VILYAAGRYDGDSGARLLDRIPDVVLRLFAEIEFAAGIAELHRLEASTREQLRGTSNDRRQALTDGRHSLGGSTGATAAELGHC